MQNYVATAVVGILIGVATNAPSQIQTPADMQMYRITLDDFRITKIIQFTDIIKTKGIDVLTTEGISNNRTYRVQFGPTDFRRTLDGKKYRVAMGIKLVRVGAKFDIHGLMNPATSQIVAKSAIVGK